MKSSTRLRLLAVLPAFPALLTLHANAETAAAVDWRPVAAPGQCRGEYVAPEPGVQDGKFRAGALSMQYAEGEGASLDGDVEITRDGQSLTADAVRVDGALDRYTAEGRVSLRQRGLLITGARVSGSLTEETAVVEEAGFLLHERRLRGGAKRLEKGRDDIVKISAGEFTACEPDDDAWSIHSRSLVLKPAQGYGEARNVSLRIKGAPVAWFPWFRFPLGDARQSGFLWPGIGNDSDGGAEAVLPWYFNLAPNRDATYTLRSMWKRGLAHEGEFRFLTGYGANTIAGAFLASDEAYDGGRRRDAGSPGEFGEHDRWLVHFSHEGGRGAWATRVNYTEVSDVDYFRDLGELSDLASRPDSGFDRSLDIRDAPARLRTGVVSHTGKHWRSTLELRSFQELFFQEPGESRAGQYEILPRLTTAGGWRSGPADLSLRIQATSFDSGARSAPVGSRILADGAVRLPFRNAWGYVTPAARVIHRDYNLQTGGSSHQHAEGSLHQHAEGSPGGRPGGVDDASITTGLLSLDAGLVLERRAGAVRQTLEPRLFYLYAEEDFQDNLPLFDSILLTPGLDNIFRDNRYTGYDRIGDANRVSLGLTTNFLSERTGARIMSAGLGRSYHFDTPVVRLASEPGRKKGWAPLFTQVSAHLGRFRLMASHEYDTGENRSHRGYFSVRYRGGAGAIFNLNYAMTEKSRQRAGAARDEEETDLSFHLPLGEAGSWRLVGRWNYGWGRNRTLESMSGLEYNDCCWKVRLLFRRNLERPRILTVPGGPATLAHRADSGVYLEFHLKGLASPVGRLDNLLRQSIPGYDPDGAGNL